MIAATTVLAQSGRVGLRAQALPTSRGHSPVAPEPVVVAQQQYLDKPSKLPGVGYSARRMPGGPKQVLVINSAGSDPKTQATLEEDLPVMWHLLNNAVGKKFGAVPNGRTAMGIDVVFAPGSSPIRSLYLDGYGVLFLLNVDFPLLPPPKPAEVQKENPRPDSAWEEAKHEVYGQPSADARGTASPAEAYDEEKVSALKSALLEGLKSGANIRGLRPEDSITVCVSGLASSVGQERIEGLEDLGNFSPGETAQLVQNLKGFYAGSVRMDSNLGEDGARVQGAILNIRVKKSDVEAFAGGKLTGEEFRKRVNVTIYASQSGGLPASSAVYGRGIEWRRK
jgi:hypothetical protein